MKPLDKIKILLVDDELSILQFLELGLQNEGAIIQTAQNGQIALELAASFKPHIIILDVMMPVMDGFETCRELRKLPQHFAIIMLTAKDEINDRVQGLTIGADDYLLKPFSFSELIARIHARIRNQFPTLHSKVQFGPFTINERAKEITLDNQILELSPTEYELLKFLIMNHGAVISKSLILDQIWGYDFGGEQNIVEVYIRSIREKIHDKEHTIIRTLRGAGYRLDLT